MNFNSRQLNIKQYEVINLSLHFQKKFVNSFFLNNGIVKRCFCINNRNQYNISI